ncbi:MAG: hypothetical protein A2X61_09495 [Ignavibacteria bacterium GWB2_35_12]|nr:MAG: hypothetical protein A2X61_09495 [Ignavibacteria bacterium GWB2_35_12]
MEQNDSFEVFLKKKKQQENNKVDWDERKSTWLKSIEDLYSKINNWLSPFIKESLLDIKEKDIELNEEYIGNYKAKRLDIYLSNDIISLTPRGTLIIGSYGRIDMRGPKGEYLLIEPDWNIWKFAKRTPKLVTWEISEESFKTAIQDVING